MLELGPQVAVDGGQQRREGPRDGGVEGAEPAGRNGVVGGWRLKFSSTDRLSGDDVTVKIGCE